MYTDLWLPHSALHPVFALNALDINVQMKLAHARQDGFLGVVVGVDAKSRVFLREPEIKEVVVNGSWERAGPEDERERHKQKGSISDSGGS